MSPTIKGEGVEFDPSTASLASLCQWAAKTYAYYPAIRDGDVTLSYRQLGEQATRAAAALISAGVAKDDSIGIWAPNCWQWLVVAMGAARAGVRIVPVNTRFKGTEAAYVLSTASAKLLFVVDGFLDTQYTASLEEYDLPELAQIVDLQTSAFEAFLQSGEDPAHLAAVEVRSSEVQPDDIAAVMFTSGTTGHPKGVMVRGGAMLRAFYGWRHALDIRPGDPYLIVNPYFHAFGFNGGILICMMCGGLNLPVAVFEPTRVLEFIERERVAMFPGPPALFQSLLNHPEVERYDLSSLRGCVTGAASIPVEMVVAMRERLGFETIVTAFGMTETSGLVTHTLRDDAPEVVASTSGCAIPNVEMRVVDDDGNDVAVGEAGELWVRGYQIAPGYMMGPGEVVRVADENGWLHTGDVVVMNHDGYIDITDRKKDMFIMGGFNAYPAEIERMMVEHAGVGLVAVIGVADERMGEVGAAFVVPSPQGAPTEQELIAWCREQMANYKVPRYVWFEDTLPLTASGKVQKPALRELAAKRLSES